MPRFSDAVWSERFDYGGMFEGERGIRKIADKYYAYVADGWGGGSQGPGKNTKQEAITDIERLEKRYM